MELVIRASTVNQRKLSDTKFGVPVLPTCEEQSSDEDLENTVGRKTIVIDSLLPKFADNPLFPVPDTALDVIHFSRQRSLTAARSCFRVYLLL